MCLQGSCIAGTKPQGHESIVDVIDWPRERTEQDFPSSSCWTICTLLACSSWSLTYSKEYGAVLGSYVDTRRFIVISSALWSRSTLNVFKHFMRSWKKGVMPEYREITDFSFWLILSTLLLVRFMKLQLAFLDHLPIHGVCYANCWQSIRQLSVEHS